MANRWKRSLVVGSLGISFVNPRARETSVGRGAVRRASGGRDKGIRINYERCCGGAGPYANVCAVLFINITLQLPCLSGVPDKRSLSTPAPRHIHRPCDGVFPSEGSKNPFSLLCLHPSCTPHTRRLLWMYIVYT